MLGHPRPGALWLLLMLCKFRMCLDAIEKSDAYGDLICCAAENTVPTTQMPVGLASYCSKVRLNGMHYWLAVHLNAGVMDMNYLAFPYANVAAVC